MEKCTAAGEPRDQAEVWPGHFSDSLSSFLLVVAAISCLFWHLWRERTFIFSLWTKRRRLVQSLHQVLRPSAKSASSKGKRENASECPRKKEKKEKDAAKQIAQEMLDKRRVQYFEMFVTFMGPITASLITVVLSVYSIEYQVFLPGGEDLFALLHFYVLCLLARYGPFPLSRSMVDTYGSCMSFALFFRICRSSGPANFFGYSSCRLTFRLSIGLCTLNHRIQGPWSLLIGWANAYKHLQFANQLPLLHLHPVLIFVNETFSSSCLWFTYYVMQCLVEQGIEAVIDATKASSERTGVKRLLAVLCDAQVMLDDTGKIIGSADSLSRMLMSNLGGVQALSKYEGTNFCNHLQVSDRERFQTFMCGSEGRRSNALASDHEGSTTSSSWSEPSTLKSAPASSLQVHMIDSLQLRFPVELFHVNISTLGGQRLHLIGIRDADGRPVEPAPSSTSSIVHSELGFEITTSQDSDDAVSSRQSVVLKQHKLPRKSLPSSRSSHSSNKSVYPLTVLETVEINIDPFAENFPITNVTFNFQSQDEAGCLQAVPLLSKWLKQAECARVMDWIRDQVNLLCFDQPPTVPFMEKVKFRMPGQQDHNLVAAKVAISMASGAAKDVLPGDDNSEERDDEDEENSDEESETLDVQLTLSGFSGQVTSSSKARAASVRSGGSRRSFLAPIEETVPAGSRR